MANKYAWCRCAAAATRLPQAVKVAQCLCCKDGQAHGRRRQEGLQCAGVPSTGSFAAASSGPRMSVLGESASPTLLVADIHCPSTP